MDRLVGQWMIRVSLSLFLIIFESRLFAVEIDNDGHFISYIGCFSVWSETRTKNLEPPDHLGPFNPSHADPYSCSRKCFLKFALQGSEAALSFVRGLECQCAPVSTNDQPFIGNQLDSGYCNYSSQFQSGGNLGYSVYRIVKTYRRSDGISYSYSNHTNYTLLTNHPTANNANFELFTESTVDPVISSRCSVCHRVWFQPCVSDNLSPSFDYFPLNSAQNCAEFCAKDVAYFDGTPKLRRATRYAVLTWWNATSALTLPICFCDNSLSGLFSAEGYCKELCPGNKYDMCGGMNMEYSMVFVSIYCIENRTGICPTDQSNTPSTTTTTTTVKSTFPLPSTSTTTVSTTTMNDESSTFTNEFTTSILSTISTHSTTETELITATDLETRETHTAQTTPTSTTTSTATTRTTHASSTTFAASTDKHEGPLEPCTGNCSKIDRHGHHWTGICNQVSAVPCSALIPGSIGKAFWKCGNDGEFERANPNVFRCRSAWVDRMREKMDNLTSTDKAKELTNQLRIGCNESRQGNSTVKYFGHEIRNLASLLDEILRTVSWGFEPSQKEFEDLVDESVKLDACLINSHEPWEDLSLEERTLLSSQLMNATEDVLFHLTLFVNQTNYTKMFTPIRQFTAVAETLEKASARSSDPYVLPAKTDALRDTFIKLPPGWTDLVQEPKIEIAVLSLAPECVAKIMTGDEDKKYEVNGEENKMINGRMISLSVTSSSHLSSPMYKLNGARSKSLKFRGKGVEIGFDHIVDAWGAQAYDVHRKLHAGEKPKVAKGGAQCVFWDVNQHMWSGEGCKLLKITRRQTVCECSHLTSFAILMDVHRYVGKQLGLEILTLILCPLSELSLFISILILSVLRNGAHKMRSTICKHLSYCLFLGNGLILIVLDRHYFNMHDGLCMGAAMVAHYTFLCAFMWMLLEGVQLYRMVVNVFDCGKSYMKQYGIVAYGSPVLIIAVTVAIGHINGDKPYGGDAYCWLVGNYIWAFMVPVALVITTNLVILFIALKTSYQLQHQGQRDNKLSLDFVKGKLRSYRIYFKGCFSLTVVLGITWVVGFFMLLEGSSKIAAAYLFTILNASQGFLIFLFTCRAYVGNLRVFTRTKLSSYFPSLLNSSSNNSSLAIRKATSRGRLDIEPQLES